MKKISERVHETFMNCLFSDEESTDIHVIGEGVQTKVGFHPERLKAAEPTIAEILDEMPDEFKKNAGGGGWSFLNLCHDKNGNQWADLHKTMDELVMLGVATGKISFLLPRELWSSLPGGMPYLVIS
ncbi:MAG: hypothetical protein V4721_10455 [Bacteroidota bacterium]